MGATYTRQSSSGIVDGGVIEATDLNNEFDQLLAAFAVSSGHSHDGTAAEGGPITKLLGTSITIGDATSGTDITVTFDGETNDGVFKWMEDEDYFEFSDDLLVASTEKLQFRDTAIYINSSADGQLDLVADTEIQIAATTVDINGAVALNGAITGATNITLSGELDAATLDISGDADIDGTLETDALSINGTTVTSTAAELNILDGVTATATELNIMDGVTATTAELNIMDGVTSTAAELNLVDGITAGTVSASKAVIVDSNKDLTGFRNLTISGDLTVSGDDITMGTNTAGNVLVADGTNFNSIAVGDLSEISSVASDDVVLAVDTSGGGLKKIARSAVVSGLASSAALSNVVEDTTPQLGGDLDVNGNGLTSTSNGNIAITPNGTGVVRLDGNVDIQSGLIDLKNSGTASQIKFYCESSNAHAQILIGAPHSESASNTLTLPSTGGDARLVSTSSTATLTNKTLTTPVIAEIDSGSTITLDATTDIVLDADGGDIFLKDGGTTFGEFTNSSTDFVIKSTTSDKDILIKGNDGGSAITALTLDMSAAGAATFNDKITAVGTSVFTNLDISGDVDVDGTLETDALSIASTTVTSTAAELNILDGVTSTAAELNILDGVTSTAAELNILDGVTSTATELNIMDGDTAASSVTLVDADRLVTNDAGTMKQVALTTLKTYLTSAGFSSEDPTALAIALG